MKLKSLIHRRASTTASPKSRSNASLRVSTPWIIIGALVLGLGLLIYRSSANLLKTSIESTISVGDPDFRDSVGPLLGAEFVGGNTAKPLINGKEFFPAMLSAISKAQKSVCIETYIWSSGTISDKFIAALIDRAKAGVKVHAMVDGAGDFKMSLSDINRMKSAGVEFVVYAREHWYQIKPNINHRTHRKLLIVDGKIGFTGGVCIDDTWMGDADQAGHWRDTQARVEGPAVREMQAVFAANWLQTTSRLLVGPNYFPDTGRPGDALVDCFKSGPDESPENARMSYLLAIASAKKSIRLSHAYFVPDDLAVQMLIEARKRGVQIDVIVPLKNDSRFGRAAARSRWGKLLAAGVNFYQFEPCMYHCKIMIVDDLFTTMGSINFDNRSFSINDEANINIIDAKVAGNFIKSFNDDLARSKPLTLDEFRNRPFYIKLADHIAGTLRSQL
ncbi:MAG: cardiolipin synthase [Lacunisphaera sp.]